MPIHIAGHLLCHRGKESLDFQRIASDDDFHLAIRQIPHIAADRELARNPLGRHAETDALHGSPVMNASTDCHFSFKF